MAQTDILVSQLLTATGNVKETITGVNRARTRIKGVYYAATVAGTIELRDGGASGTLRGVFPIGVATSNILIPGEGMLFQIDVHVTIVGATVTGITFFYG